jgi:hypothetical protein
MLFPKATRGLEPIITLTTRPQRRSTFFYIIYVNSVRTSQETHYISVLQPGTLTTRPQRRSKSKSKLYYDRQSVGQSVWVSRHPSGTRDQFLPFSDYFSTVSGLLMWGTLSDEKSVLFSFCRASPAQPFSDLSPTGLTSIDYCLYFWDRGGLLSST